MKRKSHRSVYIYRPTFATNVVKWVALYACKFIEVKEEYTREISDFHDILSNDILSNDILSNDILSNDILSNDIPSNDIVYLQVP